MKPSSQLDEIIHEMRNELAVAKANLEGLIDGKFSPTPERLAGIVQALNQLDHLIDDLRLLGPSVTVDVRPSTINVCELLGLEYAAFEAVARLKNITMSVQGCNTPAAECLTFLGDPSRIGQIIKNVLLNAVRYTPSGGTISVECRRADKLEVVIADEGPGIQTEEKDAIFTPGVRGSASHGSDGSGYGLAIVKRLVEAHGGAVDVTSASQHGAVFTVRLPGTGGST